MTTFDLSPGAQVPLTGLSHQTAATQALASAAYRDDPVSLLTDLDPKTNQQTGKFSMFSPNLGEAFSRAVQERMLGGARGQVVQSFGADPAAVVQHCLAASKIRRTRDARLTAVMAVFGLFFLPGTLLWLGAFQLRRTLRSLSKSRTSGLGSVVLFVAGLFSVLLFFRPPFSGFAQLYMRVVMLAPIVGWFFAQRICRRTAEELRQHWSDVLDGAGGPSVPEAVPTGPHDSKAETMRRELEKLMAEQNSNVIFYQGREGILGMGSRWGSWHMAEELVGHDGAEINPFRSWDVIRSIHDRLRELERGPLHTGGFPKASIRHWVVVPLSEGAGAIERPTGTETEGYSVRDFEVQRICNEQQFGSGNRHYLGVQFVLWEGQLVLTLMCTVTVLHKTLRVEVTGHTLGPVAPMLSGKPEPRVREVAKSIRFWETKTVVDSVVSTEEVVRLTVRAPFTWMPPTLLDWLGGKLTLPEPFGLRHSWVEKPWANRFMADDAVRAVTPVLRVVHAATIRVLEENGVDTEKFSARSLVLSGVVQGAEPKKADVYDA
ncbi:hypothetical protein [Wenjunlia tyrosinilytica]|uniref:Uncharacterized protein n=1 Tax=Wenjunlia tyrosinilytica TaxID=1544741 RepID=A0A917ZIK4_9ACTN|nr:hypothetical protein [Wenjunlia tyrosinilytica]GGO82472.1 hypothetical protein GCM10012280_09150 [Wenjunlia tyrosinilytica]